jgi:hypothetical protein
VDPNDPSTKHQLIDNLLSSSPPLPAPPIMQPAQIIAQERELEMQMNRMHLQHRSAAAAAHRASITSLTIDPAYAVAAVPPMVSHSSSKSRSSVSAHAPAPTSDWFAKVAVAPRPPPVAASFAPSSLAAALTDSGMLGKGGREEFARVSTREQRVEPSRDQAAADTLTIFLHPYSDVAVRPARIRLQLPAIPLTASTSSADAQAHHNPSTDEVLANLLHKWSSGELKHNFGLRAVLQPAAMTTAKWNLKMVDEDTVGSDDGDDEDDAAGEGRERMASGAEIGMAEEDLPPLERTKPVRMFGVHVLAMVVADGCEHKMPAAANVAPPTIAIPPTSPNAAASSSVAHPNPSSRNPASTTSPVQLRRYDTMRITPAHAPVSATSPRAALKIRTVSVFSNTNALLGARDHRAISVEGNAQVAADERKHTSQHAMSHDPSRMSVIGGQGGDPTSPTGTTQKFYLKIHIGDHESHILGLLKTQLLADALPLLSAKKHALVAMKADNYRFTYVDPLLRHQNDALKDMTRVLIGSLASDELNLTPRLGPGHGGMDQSGAAATTPSLLASEDASSNVQGMSHHGGSILMSSEAPSLSSFQFSLDTASNYCESVACTNEWCCSSTV